MTLYITLNFGLCGTVCSSSIDKQNLTRPTLLSSVNVDLMVFVWRLNKPSCKRRPNVVFAMFNSFARSLRVVLFRKSTCLITSGSKAILFCPQFLDFLFSSPCIPPTSLNFFHHFRNVPIGMPVSTDTSWDTPWPNTPGAILSRSIV